jgi:hypothetical protein
MRELSKHFGADRRTIARWQAFWREHFPQTRFWKVTRADFMPPIEVAKLPQTLLDALLTGGDPFKAWERLLRFLSPITIAGGMAIEVSR